MLLDKDTDLEIIQSPLNYTGGKFKLLPQILPLFPKNIDIFVDLFCGGANVGVNVESNRTILNDTDDNLTYLFNMFKILGSDCLPLLDEIIEKYGLSQSAESPMPITTKMSEYLSGKALTISPFNLKLPLSIAMTPSIVLRVILNNVNTTEINNNSGFCGAKT